MATVVISIAIFVLIVVFLGFLCRRFRIHFYAFISNFPQPKYRVVADWDIKVTMQDGTKLATDVYRPKAPGKYPVILVRTCYGKRTRSHLYKPIGELFASQGYALVMQDVRGKFDSEGEFHP